MAGKTSFVTMMSACVVVVVLVTLVVQPDGKSIISRNESLAVFASTEKTVLRRKRSFPLKETGGAKETGYYSFANKDNAIFGLIFGHLLFTYGKQTKKCEGVLIGPNHVLSVYAECVLKSANKVVYEFTVGSLKSRVNVLSIWRSKRSNYIVAHLQSDNTLRNINAEKFPSLSWTRQDSIHNYGLFPEIADNYPVLLSTPTATQELTTGKFKFLSNLRNFLMKVSYEKTPALICLRGSGNSNNVKQMFSNGASFFKPSSNTVALFGLMSQGCSDNTETFSSADISLMKSLRKTSSLTQLLCAERMSWDDVRRIYEIGLAVDDHMPRDNGHVFPKEATVIGSWNMQSLVRMNEDRPLSTEVYEAFLNVIKETQIIALQEVYEFESKYQRTSKFPNRLSRLRTEKDIKFKTDGEFAFVYDSRKVGLVKQNDQCGFLETAMHKYAYWCKFQFNGANECFTMYTAHFWYSNRTVRASEFRHFCEHSNRVRADGAKTCGRIQIISGDFNFGNARELREVASNFIDFRLLDAGPTTVAKRNSHYDRVLVSETLRLPHHYTYPGWETLAGPTTSTDLLEPYSQKFSQKDNPKSPRLRSYKPVVRSYELSDHLPVQMSWEGLNIGTWNMGKRGSFGDSKLRDVYTKVFSLFSVLAVQEVSREVYQRDSNTPKCYGRVWTVSHTLNGERLGFAYNSDKVVLDKCTDFSLAMENDNNQRSAYACVFKKKKNQKVLVVVNVHLLNKPKPTVKYVDKLINHIRSMNEWKDAYIMGDFNADDIKNKWKPIKTYLYTCRCLNSNWLSYNSGFSWTFTRIASKKTLDYIFTPELAIVGDNTPGSLRCRVIHPELEKDKDDFIIKDANFWTPYRFIGSWKELSDHYPVFMQFEPPSDPGGTVAEKREKLGVKQTWPPLS